MTDIAPLHHMGVRQPAGRHSIRLTHRDRVATLRLALLKDYARACTAEAGQ